MRKFLLASGAAIAALALPATANAAVVFTQIDSVDLNATGSDNFGADVNGEAGAFTHTFNFILDAARIANAAVLTIKLNSGDIDFDANGIDIDGVNLFQQNSGDPVEVWSLPVTLLSAGPHSINLRGTVQALDGNASYTGNLNISAVPEPATWALLIMGFGLVGAAMRRRQNVTVRYA